MKSKRVLCVVLCLLIAASTTMLSANAKAKKYVKSIKISAKKATIKIPASKKKVTKTYKVTVKVKGKASKKFKVKSGNSSVASAKVSGKNIKVTAKKAGKAVITVTTKGKNKKGKALKAKITITVKKAKKAAKKNTAPKSTAPSNSSKPSTPSTPSNPKPVVRNITLNTTLTPIEREASSGKDETGKEEVVSKKLWQSKSVFNYVPANVEELKQVHRADPLLPNEIDAAVESDDAKGRFEVVALYFAALKAFDPNNPDVAYDMMEELCESPHTKALGIDSFNNYSRSSFKSNLTQNNKYKYLGDAYFDGATPANKYKPSDPPTVILEDYVYASQPSDMYQTQICKITCRFEGADTERVLSVYQSADGKWYIFSNLWMGFTADIKAPALF